MLAMLLMISFYLDVATGWPLVQLRVLHELIFSARKMGNPAIAIRFVFYIIHLTVLLRILRLGI
jgi:hypothetical protein